MTDERAEFSVFISFASVMISSFFFFSLFAATPEDDVDGDARSRGRGANFFSFDFVSRFSFSVVSSPADGSVRISMPGDKIFGMVASDLGCAFAHHLLLLFLGVLLPNAVPFD